VGNVVVANIKLSTQIRPGMYVSTASCLCAVDVETEDTDQA